MSHIRPSSPEAILHTPISGLLPAGPRRAGLPAAWPGVLGRWLARLRERDEMRALDARVRRDAGLTDYDIAFECRKPAWRD